MTLHADHVADQTTAAVLAAQRHLLRTIHAKSSRDELQDAVIALSKAAWEAGWDQCDAEWRDGRRELGR